MASFLYDNAKAKLSDGTINWIGDTLKLMLVTSAYAPSQSHVNVSSASVTELSGTGYVAGFGGSGRMAIPSKSSSVDSVNHHGDLTETGSVIWSAINAGTVRYVLVIKEVGSADSSSLLVACIDSDLLPQLAPNGIVTNGSDLILNWTNNTVIECL